jgi:diaminopimelate decarboxylase
MNKRPRVGVRVVVPGGWSGQFGTPVAGDTALRAFAQVLQHHELDVVALHAHLGYEISTAAQVRRYVGEVLAFADQLHARLGIDLEILDFGGSLACATTRHFEPQDVRMNQLWGCDLVPRAPESVLMIREYVVLVQSLVAAHYRQVGRAVPRIFLEPGRAMTANTQMLLCRVMSIKETDEITYAVLDAGVNVAEPVRNEYHQLFTVGAPRTTGTRSYRLVGPICTPMDVLYQHWELPPLAVGDVLAIMDSGAYFVPFATSFSFGQPAIAMVNEGEHRLLRRAETFDDMVALDLIEQPDSYVNTAHIADNTLAAWVGI